MCRVCYSNDDVEVPSKKVFQIHLFQEPHPLPHPQFVSVVKGNELSSVMYIELLRLQIFHAEKVEVSFDTLFKFGSSRVRIVDGLKQNSTHEIHAWCSHVRKLHVASLELKLTKKLEDE